MTRRHLTVLASLTAASALMLLACGGLDQPADDELSAVVPTASALGLEVPGSAAAAATAGSKTFGLLGQRAELYQLTHDATRNLNGAVKTGLDAIEDIVKHPPTAVQAGVATWGPYTPPLEPLTWLLVVKKQKLPDHYTYALTARAKGDSAGKFTPILAGSSRRGIGGYVGTFAADITALHQLDPQGHPATGKLVARYDTRLGQRVVHLALAGFAPDGGEPVDLAYRFRVLHSGAGLFRFIAKADINGNGSAEEIFAMAAQWDATGAGRGDALISGGDVPAGVVVHVTECWDDGFGRTFYEDNAQLNPTEGSAAQCAFGGAPADSDPPEPETPALPENAQ